MRKPVRNPLSQTTPVARYQKRVDAVKVPKTSKERQNSGKSEETVESVPKTSKERQNSGKSEETVESSRSPSNGVPEYSHDTKLADKYRDLRRDYLILEEEHSSLSDEVKQVDRDIKKLKAEKRGLLDKLVVLEGLVEEPDFESPT